MSKEQNRKRMWKAVIIGAIIWIVVMPIIVVAGVAILRYRQQKQMPSSKAVPNLVGLEPDKAQVKAREAGFSVEVLGKDWNLRESPCKVGTIVRQIPDAGQSVYLPQIGVTTCVEDPEKNFQAEQKRKHEEYEKRGYFR